MIKSTTDKWPTAGEIAAALGVLKRAIQRRATKEAWSYEEESCNGGRRRRFDPAALPKDVRRQLKNHRLEQQIKPINPPTRPADSADPDLSTLNLNNKSNPSIRQPGRPTPPTPISQPSTCRSP